MTNLLQSLNCPQLVPGLNEEAVGELMKNVKLDAQGNIGISEFVMVCHAKKNGVSCKFFISPPFCSLLGRA